MPCPKYHAAKPFDNAIAIPVPTNVACTQRRKKPGSRHEKREIGEALDNKHQEHIGERRPRCKRQAHSEEYNGDDCKHAIFEGQFENVVVGVPGAGGDRIHVGRSEQGEHAVEGAGAVAEPGEAVPCAVVDLEAFSDRGRQCYPKPIQV